jgi:hypothetical protein
MMSQENQLVSGNKSMIEFIFDVPDIQKNGFDLIFNCLVVKVSHGQYFCYLIVLIGVV